MTVIANLVSKILEKSALAAVILTVLIISDKKNMYLVFLVLALLGESRAYDGCPGDILSYGFTGLPEQWLCNGTCVSVDKHCGGNCYQGWSPFNKFHLWEADQTCVRLDQWLHCDNYTGATGSECTPGTAGCQPLQVPCGGKCPGDRRFYKNWMLCSSGDECVLSAQVCSGYGPFCRDGSDQALRTCSRNITQCLPVVSVYPPSKIKKCEGDRSQCVGGSNTGECIDRSDGKELTSDTKLVKSEFTEVIRAAIKQLQKCTIGSSPGLNCTNGCIARFLWCNPTVSETSEYSAMCELPGVGAALDVRHLSDSVCMDRQLWEGSDCGKIWSLCPGHTAQCYYSELECIGSAGTVCSDMSHRVCDVNRKYKSVSSDEIKGEDVCTWDAEKMFRCQDNTTCIDKKLLCDGIPQCPDKSDENLSLCSCPWKLESFEGPNRLLNRRVSSASVRCQDKRFPALNITTCAVRCDGVEECLGNEDENGCQEEKGKFWGSTVALIIMFVGASILAVHLLAPCIQNKLNAGRPTSGVEMAELQLQGNSDSTTRLIDLICNTDQGPGEDARQSEMLEVLHNLHSAPDFGPQIQVVAASLQIHHTKAEVERRNQLLNNLEFSIHQGDHHVCIKNNMGTNSVTEAVLKGTTVEMMDKFINFLGSYIFCCCEIQERVFRLGRWLANHKYVRVILSLLEMSFYFLDLVKDLAVIFIMFRLMTTTNLEYTIFFFTFNGMLLLIMLYTVLFSMVLTAGYLSASHPGVELQLIGVKQSGYSKTVRIVSYILGLLIPTTLIYQLTRQKVTLHTMQEALVEAIRRNRGQVDPQDIHKLQDQKNKVIQLEFLAYMKQKNDLITEVLIQSSVNACMILVIRAEVESLTETGLQAVFSESTFFLAAGFALSLKKIVSSNMALIAAEKNGFVPFTGKCLKTLAYLITTLLRMGCVTLYFGLPLGGFNILIHKGSLDSYTQETRHLIYDVQEVDGALSVLRINDTYTITNANYTELTGLRLRWYGIIFSLGVIIHIGLVSLIKQFAFGDAFSQLSTMDKVLHVLHTVSFPEPSADWDHGTTGTIHTYRKQWQSFKRESILMMTIFTFENLLMAVPVVYICTKVVNYHLTLPYTTDLEDQTYETARTLRILWPLIVVVTPLLQGLLLIAYNKHGHPWKALYAKFDVISTTEDEEIDDLEETGDVIEEAEVLAQEMEADSEGSDEHMEELLQEDREENDQE